MKQQQQSDIAWGIDYRRIRRAPNTQHERWITLMTRLNDGRLLISWESSQRPECREVRQVLGKGLVTFPPPEILWCDSYLSRWVAPIADRFDLRLHIRTVALRAIPLDVPHSNPLANAPEAVQTPQPVSMNGKDMVADDEPAPSRSWLQRIWALPVALRQSRGGAATA